MNQTPNRQIICDVLMEKASQDPSIVVLCSDSRGSASLAPFAEKFPKQFVEVGIAEQNLVSIAAGLASCGMRSFAASPACFLSTRSLEQAKIDVAYSNTNVKLIGISGGISYGALGMTHHSTQDIATMGSIPNMRVYLPSDKHQTKKLMEHLACDALPAYVRVGRNAVADVYTEKTPFTMDKATLVCEGNDVALIACGETVSAAKEASNALKAQGISCRVLDMYCIKPLDEAAVLKAAQETKLIVTIEEHSFIGGLGSLVAQLVATHCPKKIINLALPDSPVVTGNSKEVFEYYGLTADNIVKVVCENL